MKWFERIAIPAAVAIGFAAVTCTVNTTGAPCETRDNCPSGQFCTFEGKCHSYQQGAPCSTDDHCPQGEHCAEGTCAEGAPPAEDAGTDSGSDAGHDSGRDAGQAECAIADNCKTAHVVEGQCVEGRCVVTCEEGWEDANRNVTKDGCEKETPCSTTGGFSPGTECSTTRECACVGDGTHCVKELANYMGYSLKKGVCLEDCPSDTCRNQTDRCFPTRPGKDFVPELKSCFTTGELTGNLTIVVKGACKDGEGALRAGQVKIALAGNFADFNAFTACTEGEGTQKTLVVQGFRICSAPNTPCPDIMYLYVREQALVDALNAGQTEIPYVSPEGEGNFGVLYLYAKIIGGIIDTMWVRGMASGGSISDILQSGSGPLGNEYKATVDIDLISYELAFCGGTTGQPCPEVGQ
jgi:hypothetical protein